MTGYELKYCLCCESTSLLPYLDLNHQPAANGYSKNQVADWQTYPLGLQVCLNCWHSQLTYVVERKLLFDTYDYVSGTSQTLVSFFAWFARQLKSQLPENAKVLEIASNDGSFLHELLELDVDCLGVEPALDIATDAVSRGIPTLCGYWPEISDEVTDQYDAIVCMNVLAHVDRPKEFLAACANKLKSDGLLLVLPSQARMIGNLEFDTCYHEHVSFFNTSSITRLAENCGLELYATRLIDIHGDSPLYILKKSGEKTYFDIEHLFVDREFAIPESIPEYEQNIELFDQRTYMRFSDKVTNILTSLADVLRDHRAQGFEIVFVGAAAKSMTVMNACSEGPDRILDEAPKKIAKYAPGTQIKIEPLENCTLIPRKALFVITAWNFRKELVTKLKKNGVPEGSRYYTYFPQLEFVEQ